MKYDSIEKYIEDNKYDELFAFSKKWIKDNKRDLELDEYDSAKLDDIKVEKVFFEKANETKDSIIKLYTDIIVENYNNSDGAECIYKYLRINAVVDLEYFNKSFKIGEAETYSKK